MFTASWCEGCEDKKVVWQYNRNTRVMTGKKRRSRRRLASESCASYYYYEQAPGVVE